MSNWYDKAMKKAKENKTNNSAVQPQKKETASNDWYERAKAKAAEKKPEQTPKAEVVADRLKVEKQDRDDSKLGAFFKGTAKQYGGGHASAGATMLQNETAREGFNAMGDHTQQPAKFLSDLIVNKIKGDNFTQKVEEKQNRELNAYGKDAVKRADEMIQSSTKDLEYVKEDMNGLGKFGVDVASQGLMMGADAMLSFIPGVGPALSQASLASRAGGLGASEARAEGAGEAQQLVYGAASGLLELGLEKIFSAGKLMKNMYGKGALNLADATASKAATSNLLKGITKTAKGQELVYNLTKLGVASTEEGIEEALSAVLTPFLQRAIYSDELEMASIEDILYDFAVGAVSGGVIGGAGTIADYRAGVGTAEQIKQNPGFIDMVLNKGMAQNEGTEANAFAQNLQSQQEAGKNILGSQLNELNRMNKSEQLKNDDVLARTVAKETSDISRIKENVSETEKRAIQRISDKKAEDISIDLSKKVAQNANLSLGFSAENVEIPAISRVMLGTATSADIDVILANPQAKSLLGEEAGTAIPMENSKAREMIGTMVAMNARANGEQILKESKAIIAEDLASTGGTLGAKGKQMFVSTYPQVAEADNEKFTTIFKRFYDGGTYNIPYEKITELVSGMGEDYAAVANKYFTPEMRMSLYEAGMSDSKAQLEANERSIVKREKVADRRRKGTFEDQSTVGNLSKPMRTALEKLADRAGVNIVYVDTLGNANGEYKTGRNGAYLNSTIVLAADSANPLLAVAKHELTHHIKTTAPKQYKELEDFVFSEWYKGKPKAYEEAIEKKIQQYKEAGITLTRDGAKEEILADASERFFTDESAIDRVIAYSKALGEAILDGIRTVLDSFTAIMDEEGIRLKGYGDFMEQLGIVEEAERLWMKALEASMTADVKANDGETKYSIAYTKDNRPVAVIEENILENVPEERWIKTVKEAIKGLRPGVPVGGRFINITRKTAEHFLGSDYTDMVRNKAHDIYEDKFRTAPNLDEVVYASTDYVNEDLKHGRWDNIEQFARGKVLLRIGEKNYEASVIVGYTNLKEMLLYDIQDLVSAKFELKEKRYKQHWLDKSYTRKTLVSLDKSIQENEEKINNKKSLKDTAILSDERLDYILEDKGSSGNYAQAFVTSINPRDFLKLTLSDEMLAEWEKALETGTDKTLYEFDEEKLKGYKQTPYLRVDTSTGEVIGHEGRHRMLALWKAGYKSVPILIEDLNTKYSKEYTAHMKLTSQDFGYDPVNDGYTVSVHSLYPTNEQYRDKIRMAYGETFDSPSKLKFSLKDTEERTLTAGQQEYFKNSKVRDAEGRLKVMYHGTPAGNFTVFKDGSYFTDNPEYADRYQSPSASSISYGKEATAPKTFEVYLNIKKPFDLRDPEARRVYIEDYIKGGNAMGINPYLSDAEYDKIQSIDWTEGEDLRDFLIDEGYDYDGLILDEGADGGYGDEVQYRGESYVVFSPEQVKNVDNENPTESPDIRFSLKDSEDNTLTEAQRNYFAESKIRDEDGNLLVVYHGTAEDFTVFDKTKGRANMDIQGMFFSPWELDAQGYGEKVAAYYLNIKNPAPESVAYKALKKFQGQNNAGVKAREYLESLGYDGVNNENEEFIAFNSNQIKLITNQNPTENEDIRFQLKDSEPAEAKKVQTLEDKVARLKSEFKRTDLKTPNEDQVKSQASKLIKRYGSSVPGNHTQVVQAMKDIFRVYKTEGANWDDAMRIANDAAMRIVDKIEVLHDESWQEYRDLRNYLKNTGIKLSENDKKGIADYEAFRKGNFGRLKLTDSGRPIDEVYQNLIEEYPGMFTDDYTNGVDQIRHIVDVLDSMKPWYETYDSAEMGDLVSEVAADIMETAYGLQTRKTFADRKAEEKSAAVQKAIRERDAMLARQKQKYEEKLERQKELGKMKLEDFKERQKDRQNRSKAMARLEKSYKWLKERLLTPSDTKHIPEGYQKAIATLLEGFDFETARTDTYGAKNGLSKRVIELRKFKDMCREIMESSDADQIEFDPDFMANLDEITDAIDGKRLADLDTATLDKVSRLLKQLQHQISYMNRAFNEDIKETISELGESTINEADSMKRAKEYNGLVQKLDDLLNQTNVTPSDMFELIGGTEKKLYAAMRKGFDRHVQNVQQGVKFVQSIADKKKVKQWENDLHTFRLESGEIQLTTTQLMSLYALMQREQAQNHILGSGIMSEPVEVKGDKARMKRKISQEHVMPTLEEVLQMTASLTDEQRNVADKLKDFLSNQCSDWGNETSMKLYGYKKFTEKNYFPIKSSKQFLNENFDLKNAETSLKNMGFTKSLTPGANNPIMIDDIFNVFSQHVSKMSMYNALVPAMTDFQRVYNYKRKNEAKLQTNSVQLALEKAYGKKTTEYITRFMQDLNGAPGAKSDADLATELISRYKKASLGANIRVFLQQPTAIVRAFAVISPKYFSVKPAGKVTIEEMQAHCPVAQWKSYGFYNTDVARGMKDIMLGNETIMDKLFMGSYGKADDWAWAQIWKAVKAEVEAENPNLVKDSDEYWQKVNERASEIFDRTQVVDSVFHRSQIMRNKGFGEKMITSFMAEPTKTFNLMRTEIITAQREAASGNKAAAGKRLGRVLGVYLLNGLTVSMAAAIADAMRGIGGDDDEDRGTFAQRWFAHSRKNFWENINPLNLLPLIKDIPSMINGYEIKRMDTMAFEKLISAVTMWQKVIDGSSKYTTAHVTRKTAEAISYVTGVPLANILRDAESAGKAVSEVFGNGTAAKFQTAKMTYKVTDNTRYIFADLYYDAKAEKDNRLANEIYRWMKSQGVTEEYIKGREKTWKKHKDEEK